MKTKHRSFGTLNGHAVGIVMKEMVRRAIETIRNLRLTHEVQGKVGYSGQMDDLFTTADTAAQEVYLRSIQECFPGFGVICEEGALVIPANEGINAYFTIDPLDGTKAFVRGQSHGVGSMIALVSEGEIVAAYVADTNTLEIYGYRPDSDHVYRITEFNTARRLGHEQTGPLTEQWALLRGPEQKYSEATRLLLAGGRFKSYHSDGGSIGIWLARLWKGEVAAALMTSGYETPWDSTPIIGITRKLGYVFLRPHRLNGQWEMFEPVVPTEKFKRDHDILIVHQSDLPDLADLIETNG